MARLQRTLSLGSVVLFGIAYMTPIIVLGTFGILAQSTEGMVPAAYLAALVAMFFTALSYGRMAAAFPVAGSAYSYVRKAISPKLGFIAGWTVLLDYLFLPMAIWLIGAAYLGSAFPSVPQPVWVLAFIVITTLINVVGLKLANTVNALLMIVQFLVLAAFVALSIHYIGGDASKPMWTLAPFFNGDMHMPLIMSGAAIACYSFLGFDAVSTLTEETKDPVRTIPKAIMLITLIGGLIASGLSAQASGSRLLFAMGRDGVLPKSFFGSLSERFGTPVNSIVLCAVVALLALKLDVTTSTSFINFGAFLAFSLVNLSVIFHYWIAGEKKGPRELVLFLVFPFIGLVADLWLMVSLDHLAIYLGLSWLAIGVVYLAVLTGGFRRQPPEMDFQEAT